LITNIHKLTRKKIIFVIFFITCSAADTANENEKEWCIDTFWRLYGEIPVNWEDGDTDLTFSFHDSVSLYEKKSNNEIEPALFRMELLENNENYLEVCKIWYESENEKNTLSQN
tara:strand:- start:67 stop:408 length:342 start_codon:yes stop_codon:yes gene_type:complete